MIATATNLKDLGRKFEVELENRLRKRTNDIAGFIIGSVKITLPPSSHPSGSNRNGGVSARLTSDHNLDLQVSNIRTYLDDANCTTTTGVSRVTE